MSKRVIFTEEERRALMRWGGEWFDAHMKEQFRRLEQQRYEQALASADRKIREAKQ